MGKRIIARRKGKGGIYAAPSHRYKAKVRYPGIKKGKGRVTDIIHDPGRAAPIAKIRLENGLETWIIPPDKLYTGQEISIGGKKIADGNITTLSNIPEGTRIYNIEGKPGDGGKFIRSGGGSGAIVGKGEKIVVKLSSGKLKNFDPNCRATIGIVAGGGRGEKPFGKAGKKFHSLRSRGKKFPKVSPVSMNPVDHPHGGGGHQHVGKPSSVPRGTPPGRKAGHIKPKKTGKVK